MQSATLVGNDCAQVDLGVLSPLRQTEGAPAQEEGIGVPVNRNPTVRQRRLGRLLREKRTQANLTLVQAAEHLACADSKVSRIESAQSGIRRGDLLLLLNLYNVQDPEARERFEELARDGRKRGWWHQYTNDLAPEYADYIALEADAVEAFSVEPILIPGLLQTPAYTRSIVESQVPDATAELIENLTDVRQKRRAVLSRENPLSMWVVVAESALRHQIGGADVMRDQLTSLIDAARNPNVRLQVLPDRSGVHASMFGPFVILSFPESSETDVVYVDSLLSTIYIEEPTEVARYSELFRRVMAEALPYDKSLVLVEQVMKETHS